MLASLVLVTVVACMFTPSPLPKSSVAAPYDPKISVKTTKTLSAGKRANARLMNVNSIMTTKSNDIMKSILNSAAKYARIDSEQNAEGRSAINGGSSRMSGSRQSKRSTPRRRNKPRYPTASIWVKGKVNQIMNVMIDKLNDVR